MDYAREPSARAVSHRPAAEPDTARTAVAQAFDLRRPPIAQLVGPEEELQMKRGLGVAQLVGPEEELQMKSAESATTRRTEVAPRPGASLMPANLRTGIENLSGMSMEGVNVHYGSSQPAQLNALAFARGTDIHLGPGQETHLPHEAWHVVQQAQGRVEATLQTRDGVPVNDDAGLEKEADDMGARALTLGG